jgi:hypothetical protein
MSRARTFRWIALVALLFSGVAPAGAHANDADNPDRPVIISVEGDVADARQTLVEAGVPADAVETIDGIDSLVVAAEEAEKALEILDEEVRQVEIDAEVRTITTTPNDPYHEYNWGMQASNVDDVWAQETGSDSVVIAIIDTGVTEVTDLEGRLTAGYDFVNDDADPVDDDGHGTQSAMVAAAAGNNDHGVAGACWNCRVMPVKVLGADGTGSYSDVAAGIVWAADQGADIINLSLGGPSPSVAMTSAVTYARSKGALVIAAAGNDGLNQVSYPGATPGVFGVAANTSSGQRYSWSNYSTVDADISAPGCLIAQDPLDDGWYWFCGTSAASPLVAGAAGLLLSHAPWSDAAALERALRVGAVHLPWVTRYTADGTLDAEASRLALTTVDTAPPTISLTGAPLGEYVKGTVSVSLSIGDDRGVRRVEAVSGTKVIASATMAAGSTRMGPTATLNINTQLISGTTLTLRAVDLAGNTAETSVNLTADNAPPALALNTPASRVLRGSETIAVTTTDAVSGIAATELWVGGTMRTTASSAPWVLAIDTTILTDGVHNFEVRAIDRAGNVTVRTRSYRVDNTAPGLEVTWPTSSWLRGRVEIPYSATDSASGVASVELLAGGVVIARSNPLSGKIYWNSFLTNGEAHLTIRVTDRAGNVTTASRLLQADNTLPSVTTALNWKVQGRVALTAVAADNVAVDSVNWWLVSATGVNTPALIGSGSGADWSVNWNSATVANGPARLRVDVRDAAGNLRSVQLRTTIAN